MPVVLSLSHLPNKDSIYLYCLAIMKSTLMIRGPFVLERNELLRGHPRSQILLQVDDPAVVNSALHSSPIYEPPTSGPRPAPSPASGLPMGDLVMGVPPPPPPPPGQETGKGNPCTVGSDRSGVTHQIHPHLSSQFHPKIFSCQTIFR